MKKIPVHSIFFLLLSLGAEAGVVEMPKPAADQVLMIVTNHDLLGNTGRKTGFWMEELAVPYQLFTAYGLKVDIASPKGGVVVADPESLKNISEPAKVFLADPQVQTKLAQTQTIQSIVEEYRAYFVVGGHGAMWDMPDDPHLQHLLGAAFDNEKVVAAVCHGSCALLNVPLDNGNLLVKGRRVTGFSNEEEKAIKLDSVVPFALESRLRSAGGLYESGPLWAPHVVRNGRLVTGQNPASSELTAREVISALYRVSPYDLMMQMNSARTCLNMPQFCGGRSQEQALADFKSAALEAEKSLKIQYAADPAKLQVIAARFAQLNELLAQLTEATSDKKQSLLADIDAVTEAAHKEIFSRSGK